MSLRTIHIVIILFSIALSLFFGWWALNETRLHPGSGLLVWGILSAALGVLLIPYLVWFILKIRKGGA